MQKIQFILWCLALTAFLGVIHLSKANMKKENYHLRKLEESQEIIELSDNNSSILEEFISFKWNFQKIYSSKEQEIEAFNNFVDNTYYIAQRNNESNGNLVLKMNTFGDLKRKTSSINKLSVQALQESQANELNSESSLLDLSKEIYLQKKLIIKEQNERAFNNNTRRLLQSNCQNYQGCLQVDLPRNELPLQVNHSNKTGPVRDDYPCWRGTVAFSNANLIEFLLYENTSWTNYRNVSRQQIYDCALNYSSIMPFPSTLCQQNSIGFAQSPYWLYRANTGNGINDEQDYNVTWSSTIDASRCSSNTNSNTSHFLWLWDVNPGNHTQILNQLVYRPVSISFDGQQQDILFYSSGVIENGCDTNLTPDGQLLIVGYDLTPGNEHYILKNSWSESYGDAGYLKIKIPATDDNSTLGTCGINFSTDSYSYYYTGLNNAW